MINRTSISEFALIILIVLQVLFLIFYDHRYFGFYIDIVILGLLALCAYLAFKYFQVSLKMPIRVAPLANSTQYEAMTEITRRVQIDKLMKSQRMIDLQHLRESRESSSQIKKADKEAEDDDFIRELEQKQTEIFDGDS